MNLLLCPEATGAWVICPDLFRGDVCSFAMLNTPEFVELVKRFPIEEVQKDIDFCYQNILAEAESIVLAGFCWGSWILHKHKKDKRVKGGVNYHPALGLDAMFNGSDEALVNDNKIPQLYLPCLDDAANLKPDQEGCIVTMAYEFKQRNHGFMTQGDLKDSGLESDVKKGIELLQAFFNLTTQL